MCTGVPGHSPSCLCKEGNTIMPQDAANQTAVVDNGSGPVPLVLLKLPNGLLAPLIALADLPASLEVHGLARYYNHQPHGTFAIEVNKDADKRPRRPYIVNQNGAKPSDKLSTDESAYDLNPMVLRKNNKSDFKIFYFDSAGEAEPVEVTDGAITSIPGMISGSDTSMRDVGGRPGANRGGYADSVDYSCRSLSHQPENRAMHSQNWRSNLPSMYSPSHAPSVAPSQFSFQASTRGGASNAARFQAKEYCIKWIQDGTCAYTGHGDGCNLKHIMPSDPVKLDQLGFGQTPDWWILDRNAREQNGTLKILRALDEPIRGWDGMGIPKAFWMKHCLEPYGLAGPSNSFRNEAGLRFSHEIDRQFNPMSDIWPQGAQRLAYQRNEITAEQLFNEGSLVNLNNPGNVGMQVGAGANGGSVRRPPMMAENLPGGMGGRSPPMAPPARSTLITCDTNDLSPTENAFLSSHFGPLNTMNSLNSMMQRNAPASPAPTLNSTATGSTLPQWADLTGGNRDTNTNYAASVASSAMGPPNSVGPTYNYMFTGINSTQSINRNANASATANVRGSTSTATGTGKSTSLFRSAWAPRAATRPTTPPAVPTAPTHTALAASRHAPTPTRAGVFTVGSATSGSAAGTVHTPAGSAGSSSSIWGPASRLNSSASTRPALPLHLNNPNPNIVIPETPSNTPVRNPWLPRGSQLGFTSGTSASSARANVSTHEGSASLLELDDVVTGGVTSGQREGDLVSLSSSRGTAYGGDEEEKVDFDVKEGEVKN